MFDVDGERLMRIPAELIKVQWNPWQISERNLPYLAWAMGVNLYTRISS
jgi:P2-related tail formation protein